MIARISLDALSGSPCSAPCAGSDDETAQSRATCTKHQRKRCVFIRFLSDRSCKRDPSSLVRSAARCPPPERTCGKSKENADA